ncbi:hypothetical protein DPMN_032737 [Dreissena polymorpha]|uniref:Uncharacterized protein n=1 Tax=Dreissena polymorpha TaxID=45954 RepID=A0A9D4M4P5_DREPO|nr:hypothetical protein DPMN_032737 [Dreissena polymorpha]
MSGSLRKRSLMQGYSTTTRFPTIRPDFQYFEVGDIRSSIGEGPNSFVASGGPVVSDSCNSGELLRAALLIQLNAADLSSAVDRREFAGPDLPEVPSVKGREQWDSETTSVEDIRGGPGAASRGCLQSQEHRGGGLRERPRGGGTQYAQRTGETVLGMKTTAGDNESGHKGRAVRCSPLAELRSDINLS